MLDDQTGEIVVYPSKTGVIVQINYSNGKIVDVYISDISAVGLTAALTDVLRAKLA